MLNDFEMFVRFFAFASAKVKYEHLQNQIFRAQTFPRGGVNSLIINTMKNWFLPIFQPTDNQRVTKPISEQSGNMLNSWLSAY